MRLLAILTVLVIVGATVLANAGLGRFEFLRYVPGHDVTAHFVLYAALGLTVAACLRRSARGIVVDHWIWIMMTLAVLIALEEVGQAFIPTRTFSVIDMAASLGGLAAGATAATWPRTRGARDATEASPGS